MFLCIHINYIHVHVNAYKQVWQENLVYWHDKAVFNNRYFDFIWDIVCSVPFPARLPPSLLEGQSLASLTHTQPATPGAVTDTDAGDTAVGACDGDSVLQLQEQILKLATRFVFVTLCRSHNKQPLFQWIGKLKEVCTSAHACVSDCLPVHMSVLV